MKYTAKQLGMRHKQGAAKNDQVIEMFLEDSFPKDKKPEWGNKNLRIKKDGSTWMLVNYGTPLLVRKGNKILFNIKKYSTSTSSIQNKIRKIAKDIGVILVEITDESKMASKKGSERIDNQKIAQQLVKIARSLSSEEDEFSCGFAIVTSPENVIADNFQDKFDKEPTNNEWDTINNDITKMENNALRFLKKKLQSANDEGHGSDDSLVGTCWVEWEDKKACKYVWESRQEKDPWNISNEEDRAFFKGVSNLNVVDCYVEFYAFDDDVKEKLEKMF